VHITDLLRRPCTDRIAPAYQVVRVVRVETLDAIRGSAADAAAVVEAVQRVPARDIVTVRLRVRGRELLVLQQALAQPPEVTGRLQPADGLGGTDTREPEERRKRLPVDDRMRLDDGGQTTRTTNGYADLSPQRTADLPFDGVPVLGSDIEVD